MSYEAYSISYVLRTETKVALFEAVGGKIVFNNKSVELAMSFS